MTNREEGLIAALITSLAVVVFLVVLFAVMSATRVKVTEWKEVPSKWQMAPVWAPVEVEYNGVPYKCELGYDVFKRGYDEISGDEEK